MLVKLAQLAPHLITLGCNLYGEPSMMFFIFDGSNVSITDYPLGVGIIWCHLGVHQGCVLGSYLFCLGLSTVFRYLQSRYPTCVLLLLADDLCLSGPPADAREFLYDIRTGGRGIGYVLNRKTGCWSPDGSVDFSLWGDAVLDDDGNPFEAQRVIPNHLSP